MSTSGKIHKLSVSEAKGEKKENVEQVNLIEDFGIEGDAHAGSDRQVSLLPFESFVKVENDVFDILPGDFAENITTTGFDYSQAEVGMRILIGGGIELEINQIGKECHETCRIKEVVGDCIMPREGVFARVLKGGKIKVGDSIEWK